MPTGLKRLLELILVSKMFICVYVFIYMYLSVCVCASGCLHAAHVCTPRSFTRYIINFYIFLADQAFAEERENCICVYFLPPKCQVLGCLSFLERFPLHLADHRKPLKNPCEDG